jgi:hypothetical protein
MEGCSNTHVSVKSDPYASDSRPTSPLLGANASVWMGRCSTRRQRTFYVYHRGKWPRVATPELDAEEAHKHTRYQIQKLKSK